MAYQNQNALPQKSYNNFNGAANTANQRDVVQEIKTLTKSGTGIFNRFFELQGKNTANFLSSVVTAVSENKDLKQMEPKAILACAMKAAALNLDVNQSTGFAAIVPYKKNGKMVPQFQIMVRGYIQLALRSGQVKLLNITPVFEDEFVDIDYLTGELAPLTKGDMRHHYSGLGTVEDARKAGVVGWCCVIRLTNGFEKQDYWSIDEVEEHATTYSNAYKYDKAQGKSYCPWSTSFDAMAAKTVVKHAIRNYCPQSIDMQTAFRVDQTEVKEDGSVEYIDNITNVTPENEVEDAEVTEEPVKEEPPQIPQQNKAKAQPRTAIPTAPPQPQAPVQQQVNNQPMQPDNYSGMESSDAYPDDYGYDSF